MKNMVDKTGPLLYYMDMKRIMAIFVILAFIAAARAGAESFAWAANSNYTDRVFKNISEMDLRQVITDVSCKGRIIKCKSRCREYDAKPTFPCGKVYILDSVYFSGVTSSDNYTDICALKDKSAGPTFYYIYIPDDKLQKQILNDLKQCDTGKKFDKPFVIMLGVKAKNEMNKTVYSW